MSKTTKIYLLLLLSAVLMGNTIKAQVTLEAKMDTNIMLIGDQTYYRIKASFPKDVNVEFPIFADTIIGELEILEHFKYDTTYENDLVHVEQKMLVTSFDSGWYELPPAKMQIIWPNSIEADSAKTNPVYFGVMTMQLDSANPNAITDIKAPMEAPVIFKEVAPFAFGGLLALLLAFITWYVYKRFVKKEPVFVKKEAPKEPAHIIAFRELDHLREAKIWQSGDTKEYYSRLTDIVRTYIEDRFGVLAMELTTGEIIQMIKPIKDISPDAKDSLKGMLQLADLVKFAKGAAMADENERSMRFAYEFVERTKVVEQESSEEVEEDSSQQSSAGSLQSEEGSKKL